MVVFYLQNALLVPTVRAVKRSVIAKMEALATPAPGVALAGQAGWDQIAVNVSEYFLCAKRGLLIWDC